MARPAASSLTERETQIMEILWNLGSATAESVRLALIDEPHDSTVRTLLRVLNRKGYVGTRGRQPALYIPKVARSQAQTKETRGLVARFFGGSVEALVMRLVDDEELSIAQLDEIRKALSKRRRKRGRP